jgi:hypothetical protein
MLNLSVHFLYDLRVVIYRLLFIDVEFAKPNNMVMLNAKNLCVCIDTDTQGLKQPNLRVKTELLKGTYSQ